MGLNELSPETCLRILKTYKAYRPPERYAQFLKRYFQCDPSELTKIVVAFPLYQHLLVQKAANALLADWRWLDEKEFQTPCEPRQILEAGPEDGADDYDANPAAYIQVEVAPGVRELALKSGTFLFENQEGVRFSMDVGLSDRIAEKFSRLEVITRAEFRHLASELVDGIRRWIREYNYLKGKRIRPNGKFLQMQRTYTWDDLVLDDSLRREIAENVEHFLAYQEHYRANGVPTKRGLLLYGDPGTGKTLPGKVLCCLLPTTFIWVTAAWVSAAENIGEIFEMARDLAPTIIFLEDLDFYASSRHRLLNRAALGELLTQLDGLDENEGIMVIATTNDLESIEEALRDRPSRFDRILEFPRLSCPLRAELLRRLLKGKDVPEATIQMIAHRTSEFTGAQIQELVILAIKNAIEAGCFDEAKRAILSRSHFEQALDQMEQRWKVVVGFARPSNEDKEE